MIKRALFVAAVMVATALSTASLVPRAAVDVPVAPALGAHLPGQFADWRPIEISSIVLPPEGDLGPGEAVEYRAWRNRAGRVVTLVTAYGPPLGDSVRLHRPETCYRAQGYQVRARSVERLATVAGMTDIVRLKTEKALRRETVTYWLRDGDAYVTNAPAAQLLFFKRGMMGPSDGALIRISSSGDASATRRLHDQFLKDFVEALSPEARALFMATSS